MKNILLKALLILSFITCSMIMAADEADVEERPPQAPVQYRGFMPAHDFRTTFKETAKGIGSILLGEVASTLSTPWSALGGAAAFTYTCYASSYVGNFLSRSDPLRTVTIFNHHIPERYIIIGEVTLGAGLTALTYYLLPVNGLYFLGIAMGVTLGIMHGGPRISIDHRE